MRAAVRDVDCEHLQHIFRRVGASADRRLRGVGFGRKSLAHVLSAKVAVVCLRRVGAFVPHLLKKMSEGTEQQ
jgi:hypothetical protein